MERELNTNVLERRYDREQACRDDVETWLAEALDGSMHTPFEYSFDGRELYGRDGRPLKPIFKDAIADAEQLALRDPRLGFEARRRKTELTEYQAMLGIAAGQLPNTMVVVSDFPSELMNSREDIGGYNIKRKQTYLRVIAKQADGKLAMYSQTLDHSDRYALESIYESLGFEARPGELLGQRMHLELPHESQEVLTDQLMGVYDRALEVQYGGKYYGGRKNGRMLNTYDFVRSQEDIVNALVNAELDGNADINSLRYDLMATMEKRFNANASIIQPVMALQRAMGDRGFWMEVKQAAAAAKSVGKVYSGCGMTVGKQGDQATENQLEELGYGNKSNEDKYGSLTFKCPKGHTNRRPRNQLIDKCKTCGTSVKC